MQIIHACFYVKRSLNSLIRVTAKLMCFQEISLAMSSSSSSSGIVQSTIWCIVMN